MELHVAKLKGRCIIYRRHPKKQILVRLYPEKGDCTLEEAQEFIEKLRATHGDTNTESGQQADS